MQDELYTDGIMEITVHGTIVRVDLASLSATERDADNRPKLAWRQRLIFSTEAFANSVEVMQKALDGLIEAGAVQRTPAPALLPHLVSSRDPATAPGDVPPRRGSPNFN